MSKLRALHTICEMFHDRGRSEWAEDLHKKLKDSTFVEKTLSLSNGIQIIMIHDNEVCIVFDMSPSVKSNEIQNRIPSSLVGNCKYILIIFREPTKKATQNSMHKYVATQMGKSYQIFTFKELQMNISKHALVPRHRIMSPKEAECFKTDFLIQDNIQLPLILRNDPMVRYLFAQPHNLIAIERQNGEKFVRVVY